MVCVVGLILVKGLFSRMILLFIVIMIVRVIFCFLLLDKWFNSCDCKFWILIKLSVLSKWVGIWLWGICKFLSVKISLFLMVFMVNCWLGFWNIMVMCWVCWLVVLVVNVWLLKVMVLLFGVRGSKFVISFRSVDLFVFDGFVNRMKFCCGSVRLMWFRMGVDVCG